MLYFIKISASVLCIPKLVIVFEVFWKVELRILIFVKNYKNCRTVRKLKSTIKVSSTFRKLCFSPVLESAVSILYLADVSGDIMFVIEISFVNEISVIRRLLIHDALAALRLTVDHRCVPAGRWCLCQGEAESYLALAG